ncbi:uncharacterized protein LOC100901281 [Galendromus occidentalis]|uniref:Uncharacterized protein LOC100901281 n=1 Tax=Galendromus occidentalis TaxID=34638 RepID=A0AAJ6QM14_9ACAR|nr:uncharacterized protein LOC100901281 [Galendromus occidentalis]
MESYRKKACVSEDISKQRVTLVDDRRSLDQAVKILLRYFIIGLDAKVKRKRSIKYVSHIIFATSNELIVVDVRAIGRMPHFHYSDWSALGSLLGDSMITKIGFNMQQKQQLIKDVLCGVFLNGVVDLREAFRAIELTNPSLSAPRGAPCEGLRALRKICYNLLDKQMPDDSCEIPELGPLSVVAKHAVVMEAFIVFHAYIELDRRVRPQNLSALIQELLREPSPGQFLTLSVPWSSVHFVDTVDSYLDAVEYLNECSILGFDSEWKPNKGPIRMALLQVASEDKVFLFDVMALHKILTFGDWTLLKSIFTDPNKLKLGFDTRDDSKLLEDFMGPLSMSSVTDMGVVMRAMEKLRPECMYQRDGYVFPVVRGLSRLCNILLGRPLNKSKKLSMTNWEKRPLARSSLEYAALDAHCLVLCWKELIQRLGPTAEDLIEISVIAYNVETEALKSVL